MPSEQPEIALYSYYRSSCAGRVRLALAFKDLDYKYITLNTEEGRQHDAEFARLNPSHSVPVLIVSHGLGRETVIGQSWAALEYLEEGFPDRQSLMPRDVEERAVIRTLAMIIVSDTQPVTNTRVTNKLTESKEDSSKPWVVHFFQRGMKAYEETVQQHAGKYSVGIRVTLADVCLLPAVWNVLRAGMSIDGYPTIKRIYNNLWDLPEVQKAHWANQPDTPDREKV